VIGGKSERYDENHLLPPTGGLEGSSSVTFYSIHLGELEALLASLPEERQARSLASFPD
jgi:hypothetical protein